MAPTLPVSPGQRGKLCSRDVADTHVFGDEVAQRGVAFLDRRAGLEVGGGFGVETLQRKDPAGYLKKNATKRLAAIAKLAFEVIPKDPSRPAYRQGNTLGDEHRHWFCVRFFHQYLLFFCFHTQAKVIVYAWVNDEDSKRAYESTDDAYRVFRKMLDSGHPPSDWNHLLAEARVESERLGRISSGGVG